MGGSSLLPLHPSKPADGRVCRNRFECADGCGTDAIPHRRNRDLPIPETRPQGNLSESENPRSRRSAVRLDPRRRRVLLLTTARMKRLGRSRATLLRFTAAARSLGSGGEVLMTKWVRWTAPVAMVMSVTSPACAVQYLTIAQAQKLAFPSATRFVEQQSGRVWKAQNGDSV